MAELFLSPEFYINLTLLTILEIILGVDNIVFISIISDKLPESKQTQTRYLGLGLALLMRILLLIFLVEIIKLSSPIFTLLGTAFSWKDMILITGGLFLMWKSTHEIFNKFEREEDPKARRAKAVTGSVFYAVIQILILDAIFSIDSILTAIGLVKDIITMVIAVTIAMIVMIVFVNQISDFINRHLSLKVLALSFLLTIGIFLVMEGLHVKVAKGYIYFGLFFSLAIEILQIQIKKRQEGSKCPPKLGRRQ